MSSQENPDDANQPVEEAASPATSTMVQDYVMTSLAARDANTQNQHTKTAADLLTVFIILLFSFLFLYLQKAIYFTK